MSRLRVHVVQRLTDADAYEIVERAVLQVAPSTWTITAMHCLCSCYPPSSPKNASSTPASSQPLTQSLSNTISSPLPAYPQLTHHVKAAIVSLSSSDARTALSLPKLVLLTTQTTSESTLLESLRRSYEL
ncbi:hypothetical protein EI94DRAFT_71785 [Lactarius quietus]|nr:hypothetical protein EI94DRAFT_71785 [Lactarius quietus]